jgi:hypothetical protein
MMKEVNCIKPRGPSFAFSHNGRCCDQAQTFTNPVTYRARRSGLPRLSLNDALPCRASAGILP